MMSTSTVWTAALALVVVAAGAILWKYNDGRDKPPLPPGPKRLPIIGNLLNLPNKQMGPVLRDMGKQYGDVMYFDLFGQPMIVLNSYDAAIDLLETRSLNTSDRPRIVMAELCGLMWQFGFLGYNQKWRQRRRVFHQTFQPSALPRFRPIQLRECRRYLRRLLDTPEDFLALARHEFAATIMDAVYGITVLEKNDPYINMAEKETEIFSEIFMPGRYLVELLPILKHIPAWFPGAKFKRDAAKWEPLVSSVRHVPYNATLEAIARGDVRPSMVTSLVDEAVQKEGALSISDDACFRDAAGLAYVTGADTTMYSMQAFFLAMVQYPEAQKKAQEELDAVIGPERLPEFTDRDSLPYVNAVVKEMTRWHTVVPLGLWHRSRNEDQWNGYMIPAGSIILANQWAMARDPEAYPAPETFLPERFLGLTEHGASPARDPEKFQFGFGRRICPGRHFSNDSLFITVASLLHVFNIDAPLDEDGKPVPVEPAIALDSFLHPEPFKCRITPRSDRAAALIRSANQSGHT
ncbi:O-methylsterigmatocystin oxidoreductase [Cubamyces sp. BRFM 1775]|nr:O-methylsterigmatocystin oxidoreductase [Cubamyces sp. BRFM 1775]